MRKKPYLARFSFETGPTAIGWSTGELWNGFGVPSFDADQLKGTFATLRRAGLDVRRVGDELVIRDPEGNTTRYEATKLNGRWVWKLDGLTWHEQALRGTAFNETSRYMRAAFTIPGWSVGYHREIGAHAAIRTPLDKRDWLFIMTTPDDREPRSLDEEVVVGLHFFDGENWDQIAYQDFPSVADVLRLSDAALWLKIEHDLSVDQARELLVGEFEEWAESNGKSSITSWMTLIFKEAGVPHTEREFVESAAHEAIAQIENASPAQILDYMTARGEALNE